MWVCGWGGGDKYNTEINEITDKTQDDQLAHP